MIARAVRWMVWALLAVVLVQAAPGRTQNIDPPPTLPGEELMLTADGCGYFFRYTPNAGMTREKLLEAMAKYRWTGPCRNGLLHGRGKLGPPEYQADAAEFDYFYGRVFGRVTTKSYVGEGRTNLLFMTLDGRSAVIPNTGDPYTAYWGDVLKSEFYTLLIGPGGAIATTVRNSCIVETARFRGCSYENAVTVYGFNVYRSGETPVTVWCPDPKTPVGCEDLWRQHAGATIAAIQALEAEVARDGSGYRQRLIDLNAARDAQIAVVENERRQAQARSAAERQAAADRIAAEQRAAAEKETAEFQAALKNRNAGQLFAYADELRAAGDTDKAREVLRTMLSRFPDHPLSVTAAQQLSAMSSAPSSPGGPSATAAYNAPPSARPNPASAPPTTASGSCANAEAEEERLGQQAYQSGQKFPGEVVRPMESLLWAVGGIVRMYESCPSHPNAAAKLQTYRKLYSDTMTTCSQLSSVGRCTARLH